MADLVSCPATLDDLDAATEVMTLAFASDPVWGGWAFPDPDLARRTEQRWAFWRFSVASALRYPWVRMTPSAEAVAMWIPPGGTELTAAEEEELRPLLVSLVGDHAETFMEGLGRFEASHPRDREHYYLSLLGTHDDHRGKGIGIALLEENLRLIDEEGMPAYLESSNPANLPRYERLGFRKVGEFTLPNGPTLDTMWREPGGVTG